MILSLIGIYLLIGFVITTAIGVYTFSGNSKMSFQEFVDKFIAESQEISELNCPRWVPALIMIIVMIVAWPKWIYETTKIFLK